MSTTAGVGSQDYVAVNTLAIAAILLGLASPLVLLGSVMLVLPALGVICGVAAWWQIRQSSGTQTGRLLAGAGIVLAVVFAALSGAKAWSLHMQHLEGQKQVAALIEQLSAEIQKQDQGQDWSKAYHLFDERFQERVTQAAFAERWKSLQNTLGAIKSLTWNGAMPAFEDQPGTAETIAVAMVRIEFKQNRPETSESMIFRKVKGEQWQIEDFPILFPQNGPPGGPGGSGGAVGPNGPVGQ
jgi:hypothetical protein